MGMSRIQKLLSKIITTISNDDILVKEYFNKEKDKICCVCYEGVADQKLECAHSLCSGCYPKIGNCPICRVKYQTIITKITNYTLMDPPREISIDEELYSELDWGIYKIRDPIKDYASWNERLDDILRMLETYEQFLQRCQVMIFCHLINTMLNRHVYSRTIAMEAIDGNILTLSMFNGNFIKEDFRHITKNETQFKTLRLKTYKIINLIKNFFEQDPERTLWWNPLR